MLNQIEGATRVDSDVFCNYSASQPAGPGFVSIGAEAFYLQQLSADSGQREIFGDFKGRSAGIGPVLGYVLPVGKNTLVTEFRWLPELDTKNRLKGDYLWLKIIYQF